MNIVNKVKDRELLFTSDSQPTDGIGTEFGKAGDELFRLKSASFRKTWMFSLMYNATVKSCRE